MFVSTHGADSHAELAEGAEKKAFSPRSPRPPRENCLGLEVGGCAASFSEPSLGKRPLTNLPLIKKSAFIRLNFGIIKGERIREIWHEHCLHQWQLVLISGYSDR